VSKFLACSSDKGTIHIFAIRSDLSLAATTNKQMAELNTEDNAPVPQPQTTDAEKANNTKSMFSFMKGILPKYVDSEWSFAQFRIVDNHSICAIKDNKIIAISQDGNYYLAEIDAKTGGDCKKILQRALLTEDG
jgi:hypothetical protein